MLTKIDPESALYKRALRREGIFWKAVPEGKGAIHPSLQKYKDSVESAGKGDRHTVLKRLGPFKRGLSIGCGAGVAERELMKRGIVDHFTFLDVSEASLTVLQESLSPTMKRRVSIENQDINFLKLNPDSFDFIFCANVLHHVINLEHVLLELNKALTKNGVLFVDDYVGEARFQHSDERISRVNAIGREVKERFGVPITPLRRTGRKALINSCPFEAVRSDDILPLIHKIFAAGTIQEAPYFAVLRRVPFVISMKATTTPEKRRLKRAVEYFITMDQRIIAQGLLSPLYVIGYYRKNPRPPRIAVQKWSHKELRYHLPVKRINEKFVFRIGQFIAKYVGKGKVHAFLRNTYMRVRS